MANNLQQLSTLFLTLVSTSGGLLNGLKLIGSALLGPLGIIVAFQILFMWMEKSAMQAKKTASVINNVAIAWKNSATELEIIRDRSNTLTDTELDNIELRIKGLKEEAKVRAQIAEVQRLQSELLKIDKSEAESNLNWWQTAMNWTVTNLGEFIDEEFKGANITKSKFRKDLSYVQLLLMGEGANNKTEKSQEIAKEITDLIDAIDVEVLKRLNKDKPSDVRGPDQQKAIVNPITGLTPVELNEVLSDELYLLSLYQYKKDQLIKKSNDDQKKAREEDLEHRLMVLDAIGDGMQSLGYVIGKETQAGKAIAAAGALIETYSAITKTLAAFAGKPIPGYAICTSCSNWTIRICTSKKDIFSKCSRGRFCWCWCWRSSF